MFGTVMWTTMRQDKVAGLFLLNLISCEFEGHLDDGTHYDALSSAIHNVLAIV